MQTGEGSGPAWKPVSAVDRRVLGVLVEKAKTTPEAYPLTINAICTGCNQKSNRFPMMDLEPDDVQSALDRLREAGAVVEVQGGGRVPKFRHLLYEWLGVEKVELAVMAELLLRGAQTEGELRGRAARMEPIADLAALRPVLISLKEKRLVIPLSAEGRGHVVTHALYEPRELERLRAEYAAGAAPVSHPDEPSVAGFGEAGPRGFVQSYTPPATDRMEQSLVQRLQSEVSDLRSRLAQLSSSHDDVAAMLATTRSELASLKASLGIH